jgi:tape measure domain-containing protein
MFMGKDVSLSRTGRTAEKNISGSADRINSKVGMMAGAMAKAGLASAALFSAAAIKQGVQYNANLEQAQIGFTTMLGSGLKAKKFLDELQNFAAKTPFQFPELVTASQRMIAFGFSSKDVIPNLTAIGDAAAGLGIGAGGVEQITTAIGQMQAKTRVQSDEILQLTEAGVPALRILANQYHVTTAQMQEMITKGVVKSSEAIPRLLQGIEKGTSGAAGATTRFGSLMAAQSKTLTGVWSNFVDISNRKLGQLIAPAMPAIKAGLSWLTDAMSGNGPAGGAVSGFANRFKAAFSAALPSIREIGSSIGGAVMPVLKAFGGYVTGTIGPMVGTVFRGIASVLKTYSPMFRDMGRWIATAVFPVLASVGKLFTTVIFPIVVRFFKACLPGFRDLFSAVKSVWGSVVILWNALKPIVGPLLVGALAVVLVAFRTLAWVTSNVVAPAIRILAVTIQAVFDWVPQAASRAWNSISDAFKSMWNNILRPAVQGLWNVISGVFGSIINGAAKCFGWVPGLGGKLKDAARSFNNFRDDVNRALSGVNNRTVLVGTNFQVTSQSNNGDIVKPRTRAAGGPVSGIGTETSDSNPYWLSRNEYVVRASAHRKYGTGFLNALNAGKLASGGPAGERFQVKTVFPATPDINAAITRTVDRLANAWASAMMMPGGSGASMVADAIKYNGHRYVWGGGANPQTGWDCSSFASFMLGTHGFRLPGGFKAPSSAHGPTTLSYLNGYGTHVPWPGAPGDLYVNSHHMGIVVGKGRGFAARSTATGTGYQGVPAGAYTIVMPPGGLGSAAVGNVRSWDTGAGMLRPGLNYMYNGTGKPEPLANPEKFGTGGINVTVNVQGHSLSSKQDLARAISDALQYGQDHGVKVPYVKR